MDTGNRGHRNSKDWVGCVGGVRGGRRGVVILGFLWVPVILDYPVDWGRSGPLKEPFFGRTRPVGDVRGGRWRRSPIPVYPSRSLPRRVPVEVVQTPDFRSTGVAGHRCTGHGFPTGGRDPTHPLGSRYAPGSARRACEWPLSLVRRLPRRRVDCDHIYTPL